MKGYPRGRSPCQTHSARVAGSNPAKDKHIFDPGVLGPSHSDTQRHPVFVCNKTPRDTKMKFLNAGVVLLKQNTKHHKNTIILIYLSGPKSGLSHSVFCFFWVCETCSRRRGLLEIGLRAHEMCHFHSPNDSCDCYNCRIPYCYTLPRHVVQHRVRISCFK